MCKLNQYWSIRKYKGQLNRSLKKTQGAHYLELQLIIMCWEYLASIKVLLWTVDYTWMDNYLDLISFQCVWWTKVVSKNLQKRCLIKRLILDPNLWDNHTTWSVRVHFCSVCFIVCVSLRDHKYFFSLFYLFRCWTF